MSSNKLVKLILLVDLFESFEPCYEIHTQISPAVVSLTEIDCLSADGMTVLQLFNVICASSKSVF
jgi:hypothetical protein